MGVPIYKSELACGLTSVALGKALSYYGGVGIASQPFDINDKVKAAIASFSSKAENKNQFDLHYLDSFLVSIGLNKNDDYFDKVEVWIAKDTPEDKPWNYEHDCSQIIGHITGNCVVDDEGKIIPPISAIDNLPAKYHILTHAVLYKYWDKAELQERMNKLIAEIGEEKWFVSMECLFNNFDYILFPEKGPSKVIARNEETAFLTKNLRSYGGTGIYQDQKIGRFLRNITFSGKGLVRKPANPESLIFSRKDIFTNKSNFVVYSSVTDNQGVMMATEIDITNIQKQLDKALEANTKLQDTVRELNEKGFKAENEKLLASIKVLQESNTDLQKKNEDLVKSSQELQTKLSETEKTKAELASQLSTVELAKKKMERAAIIVDKLKAEVADAEKLADTMTGLTDEQFGIQVSVLSAAVAKSTPAPLAPKSTPAPLPPKSTPAPAPLQGQASEVDPAEGNATPTVIESAKPVVEPALAVNNTQSGVDNLRKSVAKFFGCKEGDN